MLKRVAIMLFCLMMVFIATFGFVVGVVAVPTIYSYAVVNDDSIYVPLRDPSDAVIAFQAYCKSRDLTIEGSLTDAVTTFTTGAFNSACNELGINVSQLQAELKAEYDQSGKPIKFLLNDTGVMAMNRIFAQFLQDNELEVGDSANENSNTVYDGEFYDNGNQSGLIYYVTTNSIIGDLYPSSNIIERGSPYKYSNDELVSLIGNSSSTIIPFEINENTTINFYGRFYDTYQQYQLANTSAFRNNTVIKTLANDGTSNYGYVTLVKNITNNAYYIGTYSTELDSNGTYRESLYNLRTISIAENVQSTNIYIYSTTINNNVYEGDTIINNDGDVIDEPDPIPPGGTDPGWDIGGGGGTATDGDGNTWNIQFPDFELPDLNIDWSINGLGEKFPFSIPFDLVALVTVLNAEPQAPRFEGTVNFGFTTWDYDINLQQFDSVAQACRIAELLLLVVGLILVTRSIIKG